MGRGVLPSLRSRGGIPVERDIASVFLDWLLCTLLSFQGKMSFCGGDMLMKVGSESGEIRVTGIRNRIQYDDT
jgi:hypothetical protein